MNIDLGVLDSETIHSIFHDWRSCACFDAFWSIIKLVHRKSLVPYFWLFEMTIKLPIGDAIPLFYAQTHRTYYNLTR